MSDKRAFAFRAHADVDNDTVDISAALTSSSTTHVESLELGSAEECAPSQPQDRRPRSTVATIFTLAAGLLTLWLVLAHTLLALSPAPPSPPLPPAPMGPPSASPCPPLACENGVLDGGAQHEVCIMNTTVTKQIRQCHGFSIRCRSLHYTSEYTRSRWALYQAQLPGFFSPLLSQTHTIAPTPSSEPCYHRTMR